MKFFHKLVFLLVINLIFALNCYAAISSCSLDEAYADGILDAKNKVNAQVDYSQNCDAQQNFHNQLNTAYRTGYSNGSANIQISNKSCINTTQSEVCGYDCQKNNFGEAKCAAYPTQNCLVDKFSGKVICGYDCVKSGNGTVYCAQNYDNNCAKDAYGMVKCGLNCRIENDNVKCDQRLLQNEPQ